MKKQTLAKPSLPTTALNFAADAGQGLEGTSKADFAIPFLTVLQGLSPQLATVPGAKPGLILNTITNELFTTLHVIPCAYQRRYIRWAPRSAGGGFRGELSPLDVETGNVAGLSQHEGTYLLDVPPGVSPFDKEGKPCYDHLADTRNHFVLAQSAKGVWQPALLSLSSTQIKKSKRWMSRIQGLEVHDHGRTYTPPSFSHSYTLSVVQEKNAKGQWHGLDITLAGPLTDAALYAAAKRFHDSVSAGAVTASPIANL
jgi:hypothetical protein